MMMFSCKWVLFVRTVVKHQMLKKAESFGDGASHLLHYVLKYWTICGPSFKCIHTFPSIGSLLIASLLKSTLQDAQKGQIVPLFLFNQDVFMVWYDMVSKSTLVFYTPIQDVAEQLNRAKNSFHNFMPRSLLVQPVSQLLTTDTWHNAPVKQHSLC